MYFHGYLHNKLLVGDAAYTTTPSDVGVTVFAVQSVVEADTALAPCRRSIGGSNLRLFKFSELVVEVRLSKADTREMQICMFDG